MSEYFTCLLQSANVPCDKYVLIAVLQTNSHAHFNEEQFLTNTKTAAHK